MKRAGAPTFCEHWLCDNEYTFVIKLHTRTEPLLTGDGHSVCAIHLKQTLTAMLDSLALDENATGITIVLG